MNKKLMIEASRFRSPEEKRSCIVWTVSTFAIGLIIVCITYGLKFW